MGKALRIGFLLLTGLAALLSLAVLPFWFLGVPGVHNEAARGWSIGLQTLMLYPAGWFVAWIAYLIFPRLGQGALRRRIRHAMLSLIVLLCLLAGARIGYAFHLMGWL